MITLVIIIMLSKMSLTELSIQDLQFIKESLQYTRKNFEEHQGYPSYEFKQKRIGEANEVLGKINVILSSRKKAENLK